MVKKRSIDFKTIALLLIITTILATFISLSRYKSTFAAPSSFANIGKPIINLESSQTITLEKMKPGSTKEYIFSVKNQENNVTTDIVMAYTLKVETGSYLPLSIELYSINNGIVGTNNLLNNTNSTSERELSLLTETHNYKLVVKWLSTEKNYKYSEEIDYIKIILNSYQKNSKE